MEKHPKEKCLCDFSRPHYYHSYRRVHWPLHHSSNASVYKGEWTICKNDNIHFSNRLYINNRWKLKGRCDEYLVYYEARFGDGEREGFVRLNVVLCGRLGRKLIMVYVGPSMNFPKHREILRM